MGLSLLWILSFVAYRWIFDYFLVLQRETPASFFVFNLAFLKEWLDRPGDPLLYLSRFCCQFFHVEWLGALVIALLVTGFGAILYLIRRRRGTPIGLFHTFAPCAFLLTPNFSSTAALGLLVAGSAFWGYLLLPRKGSRQVYAVLVTPIAYLVAGGYSWFFVVWVIAAEWFDQPLSADLPFKLLYPLFAACLPLIAYRWIFPISLRVAWLHPFFFPPALLDRLFFAYLLWVPLWPRVWWGHRLESLFSSTGGAIGQAVLALGLAAFLLAFSYDPKAKQFAEYHRLYRDREWDAILDRATRHPPLDEMSQFFANYALSQKGRLLEEMFEYPQRWGTHGLILDLPNYAEYGRKALYNSDLYFELGHVNAAYKLAYNQLYILGETYANLRRLAECAMANGKYEIARKYLKILAQTLFHRSFAQHYQDLIADPESAARYLTPWRARRPTVEIEIGLGDFACLLALVKSRPNRLAFDYLTAWCLLDKAAVPLVAENLHRFREVGYASLPRHCQEALMVWERKAGLPIDREGLAETPDIRSRFQQFEQQAQQYADKSRAELGLKPAFGDTYMYYYLFVPIPFESSASSAWLSLGNELYAQGQLAEAISYYRQALRRQPQLAEAHLQLSRALRAQGRFAEAADHYRQALAARPGLGKVEEYPSQGEQLPSH